VQQFTCASAQAVPYFPIHLSAVASVDRTQTLRLIAELSSDRFVVRQKATKKLEALEELAEADFRQALADKPSLETRERLEGLLSKLRNLSPARLQELRAVEILELVDGPQAQACLTSLAQGAPEALLTKEAKAALERRQRAAK